MAYRNETKGARAIHLTNGTHVLVEPGALSFVDARNVRRLAPGFVECEDPEVPPVPEDLADAVQNAEGDKPEASMSLKKDELVAIAEAEGVEIETDDNKSDLIRKIEKARG